MMEAIGVYRSHFRPSDRLERPYVMLGVNVFAADTDEEGRRLYTSLQQAFVNLRRGRPGRLQPPNERFVDEITPLEHLGLTEMLSTTVVGAPNTVRRALDAFVSRTGADELIVASQIFDHAARLRSFEIVKDCVT